MLELGLELQRDAQRSRARLQNVEQPLAADAAKAVARRPRDGAAIEDGDIVPVHESVADRGRTLRIVSLEIRERFLRQDDAPAERVRGPVALDDEDVVIGMAA